MWEISFLLFHLFVHSVTWFSKYWLMNISYFEHNPMLVNFVVQILQFMTQRLFQLAHVSLWHWSIIMDVFVYFVVVSLTVRWPRIILYISCLSPLISQLANFPRKLRSLNWRNQDLGIRYIHYYLVLLALGDRARKSMCVS